MKKSTGGLFMRPITETMLSEGGLSILFVLPYLIYFFLWAAVPSI